MTSLARISTQPNQDLQSQGDSPFATRLLGFDPETLPDFNRRAFEVHHRLAGHKLFSLERLVELASSVPAGQIEYNAGDLPVGQDPARTPGNGLSVAETVRNIETCRSWLVIKRVERDPAYRAVLDACLDEVYATVGQRVPGMSDRQGFIFISSPGSVTPFHIDPEYNFLLQIRGTKTVHTFDGTDRAVMSTQSLEGFYSGAHRNLPFDEAIQAKAVTFTLRPGDGLHIPVTAPHWVRNGNAVSVSFSLTFRTPESDRRRMVHAANASLRRLGVTPSAYGASAWRDSAKVAAQRVVERSGIGR